MNFLTKLVADAIVYCFLMPLVLVAAGLKKLFLR